MPPPRKRVEKSDPSKEQEKSAYALAAEARRQPWSIKTLREWRARMGILLSEYDSEIDRAERHGLKAVPIDGVKKYENAEKALAACVCTVANGINDAKYQ